MNNQTQASQYFRESLQQSVSNHFGDYQVCQQINHGGFGHVFKLIQRKTKRIFVMKVLDRTKKGQQSKIKNQINIHQSLKSRYILRFNNKFYDDNNYYMVLEYCEKGDMFTYMHSNYPNFGMPIDEVKKIMIQVARGISYLHKEDIIHGDIKPNNILINSKDQIKICDFGLSSRRKNKEKVNGAKGTLSYLAPQCIFPYDEKVDIWAFGVLIYFLSTGTLPFQISSYKQLTQTLTQEKLKKFQYPQKLDSKLKHLLRKIFVYDPIKRYSISDIINHPFFTGKQLEQTIQNTHQQHKITRIRSHASTGFESVGKLQILKTYSQTNNQKPPISKRSRPNSQNRDYDLKQTKQRYLSKIMQQKTRMFQKNQGEINDQNNKNSQNVPKMIRKDEKQQKIEKMKQIKQIKAVRKQSKPKCLITPLNTQNMVIKPIKQNNHQYRIDLQGVSQISQSIDQQGNKKTNQMRISPNGQAIYVKLGSQQKFYNLKNLPQKLWKEYENCRKLVEKVQNYTPKLHFIKRAKTHQSKEIQLQVMFSGKIIITTNDKKLQTTQQELQQCITFADNKENHNSILSNQEIFFQVRQLYLKLIDL